MSKRRLTQLGDTIVEVLICMAIAGLALGLAYGTTRRSLNQIREAEERQEAVKLAEEQIERLQGIAKSYVTNSSFVCAVRWHWPNTCFQFKDSGGTWLEQKGDSGVGEPPGRVQSGYKGLQSRRFGVSCLRSMDSSELYTGTGLASANELT